MAKQAEKQATAPAAAAPAAAEHAAKKRFPLKMIVAALVVVGLEGGTVAITMLLNGGPKQAAAAPLISKKVDPGRLSVEVPIESAKLPNSRSGQLYLYDISVVATVREANAAKVKKLLADRAAQVEDHIRAIVASADPKSLAQPGLQTLRRQIRYQLGQDLGRHLIRKLLIPKCTPFRAEF